MTWHWDYNHLDSVNVRVDGTDLCLSTLNLTIESGTPIVLAKCPTPPWEFWYYSGNGFRIKVQKICEYRHGAGRRRLMRQCSALTSAVPMAL